MPCQRPAAAREGTTQAFSMDTLFRMTLCSLRPRLERGAPHGRARLECRFALFSPRVASVRAVGAVLRIFRATASACKVEPVLREGSQRCPGRLVPSDAGPQILSRAAPDGRADAEEQGMRPVDVHVKRRPNGPVADRAEIRTICPRGCLELVPSRAHDEGKTDCGFGLKHHLREGGQGTAKRTGAP